MTMVEIEKLVKACRKRRKVKACEKCLRCNGCEGYALLNKGE